MNLIKRVKRFWELSKKDPKAIERLESLTKEDLAYIPEIGNADAVFFGEGTKEEFEDFKKEESGLKAWYKRLENL